jgi:Fe-S cluster assembly protein SufD
MTDLYNYLSEYFEKVHLPGRRFESPSLLKKRMEGFQLFQRKGLPTTKEEDWKFTNLNRLLKDDFRLQPKEDATIPAETIEGLEPCRLVVHNGKLVTELSDILPEGVSFYSTEAALADLSYSDKIESIARRNDNAMLGLNAAFFSDFYVLHIKSKKLVEKPIHISHHFSGDGRASFIAYRLLVITDELSESTLIETFSNDNQSVDLISYVSEISLAPSSVLHSHLINNAGEGLHLIHHREVEQFDNSTFNNSNLTFGDAPLIRTDLNCRLKGSGTQTNLYGSYILTQQQHTDNHTIVDHQKPNSNSLELYKGIMMDRSHGVFNGKILVRQDAQKTNAFQKNNNILMSDQATINSKPQLEIFADDVKCSHGSTVGQFDEEALFYLRTRGIGEERAKRILIEAFIAEVHSKISVEALRNYVSKLLRQKLQTDLVTA